MKYRIYRPLSLRLTSLICVLLIQGCALNNDESGPTTSAMNRLDSLPQGNSSIEQDSSIALNNENDQERKAVIKKGTGQVVANRLPSIRKWKNGGDGVDLNFQNADIRSVADAIFGKILGKAYSVDPALNGRITLQTSQSLPQEALLLAFEGALETVGGRLVFDGVAYQIQSAASDNLSTTQVVGLSNKEIRAGYGIHILPVKHVSATRIAELIDPFIPARAKVSIESQRNLLIIAGTGPERMSLIDMVSVFDVDWMKGMSYALLPLEAANASDVIRELDTIFANISGETNKQSEGQNAIRFMPVERMNAIMVIAVNPELLTRTQEWIATLDQGGQSAGNRLYVYRVQNGRARDLAMVLGGIFGAEQRSIGGNSSPLAPGLTPANLNGQNNARNNGQRTNNSNNNNNGGVSNLQSLGVARQSVSEPQLSFVTENMRIIADDRNNALLIMASQQDYRLIKSSLKQLDIEPLQVLIEATVAEVVLNDQLSYGLQWFFQSGDFDLTLSSADNGTVASTFPGFSGVFDDPDARIVLDALNSVTDVEIVSSPQLMVLNNQTATLRVGDEVPVPVRGVSAVTQDPDAPLVNEIEYRNTGVILRVTPRVNSSGMVLIDVEQEVSNVVESETDGIQAPTIQQRLLASTVAVKSGATIALGGLIQEQLTETESGLPVVSQIPIMGNLFKRSGLNSRRTELLVMITPRVIGSVKQAQEVTRELRERMSRIAPPQNTAQN